MVEGVVEGVEGVVVELRGVVVEVEGVVLVVGGVEVDDRRPIVDLLIYTELSSLKLHTFSHSK